MTTDKPRATFSLGLVFLIIAIILFILAGLGIGSHYGLGWFGLAFFAASSLV